METLVLSKNEIQHQKSYNLFEFMQDCGTENQSKEALLK